MTQRKCLIFRTMCTGIWEDYYRLMEEQKCQNTSNDRYRRNSLLIIRIVALAPTTIKDVLIKSHCSCWYSVTKQILDNNVISKHFCELICELTYGLLGFNLTEIDSIELDLITFNLMRSSLFGWISFNLIRFHWITFNFIGMIMFALNLVRFNLI